MDDGINNGVSFVGGLGVGAGIMYLLDPDLGNRRRMLLRDKAVRGLNQIGGAADKTLRDLRHRTLGTFAQAWSGIRRQAVDDVVLVDRVRSKLGRVASHPGSIQVTAQNGCVSLSGPILESEADRVVSAVCSVPGVSDVENRLEVHKQRGDVPGLQGGTGRPGDRFELLQTNWAPATRFLVGASGAALGIFGFSRRDLLGGFIGTLGIGMLLRGATNLETRRLLGVGGGRRGIHFQKTININAPVEELFNFWAQPENFPRIMSHVREVKTAGNNIYHWTVVGPAGISVAWDAEIVQSIPNELLSWRSVPGSLVRNAGTVRFEANPEGGTRVHLLMTYNPPAGAIGHALAALFGADPKRTMDEDLARLKSLFEHGKTTAHGETVTRERITA